MVGGRKDEERQDVDSGLGMMERLDLRCREALSEVLKSLRTKRHGEVVEIV